MCWIMPWKFRFRNITCIGNLRWCIRGECRLDCFGWDLLSRYPLHVLCSASSRTRFQLFPALVSSDARPQYPRACAPPQTHFPWKLTGEISFDDIAAAGGPPDQWDALPTNAKLQIILFIGPRFVFFFLRTAVSTDLFMARMSWQKLHDEL